MNGHALGTTGGRLAAASWVGTAAFALSAVVLAVSRTGQLAAVVVDLALFAGGVAAFMWALVVAARRSRQVEMGIGGLFFLQGSAPRAVQVRLLGSLGAEVVVALATAAARPFTALAFGVLVPMWGLGLAGLWGAKYGRFGRRTPRMGSGGGPGGGGPDRPVRAGPG